MHSHTRRAALAAIATALLAPTAFAQGVGDFPYRPIRVLVTNAAGGGSDLIARMLGTGLTAALGQPVVIENQPGANGIIALANTAKAAPDGYTLVVTHGVLVSAEAFGVAKSYQLNQLMPLAMIGTVPTVFAVNPSMGVNTVGEFVAKVRAMPQGFPYASFGNASSGHLLGEMLKRDAKLDMTHVAYKGATPAVADLIAGHVQAAWAGMQNFQPHMPSGKVKVIGVSGTRRHPNFPEVPTFAESGYPDMVMSSVAGVLAPAGTPKPIADRLTREILKIVRGAEMTAKLNDSGYYVSPMEGSEFGDYVKADIVRWRNAATSANIKLD